LSVNDLYSEIILEHYKEPHNTGELDCPEVHAKGFNESCGDDIKVFAKVKDGIVDEIKFVGRGCAISQSSASMMTDMMHGKTIDEAKEFVHQFTKSITGEESFPDTDEWFELSALKGVVKFPIRVKCASLAWHTLLQGIKQFENKK
jgi:nitrogen fixation protein NifU and related proteins